MKKLLLLALSMVAVTGLWAQPRVTDTRRLNNNLERAIQRAVEADARNKARERQLEAQRAAQRAQNQRMVTQQQQAQAARVGEFHADNFSTGPAGTGQAEQGYYTATSYNAHGNPQQGAVVATRTANPAKGKGGTQGIDYHMNNHGSTHGGNYMTMQSGQSHGLLPQSQQAYSPQPRVSPNQIRKEYGNISPAVRPFNTGQAMTTSTPRVKSPYPTAPTTSKPIPTDRLNAPGTQPIPANEQAANTTQQPGRVYRDPQTGKLVIEGTVVMHPQEQHSDDFKPAEIPSSAYQNQQQGSQAAYLSDMGNRRSVSEIMRARGTQGMTAYGLQQAWNKDFMNGAPSMFHRETWERLYDVELGTFRYQRKTIIVTR